MCIRDSTTGEDGLLTFDRVMSEAERLDLTCAGILVLNEDQQDWVKRIRKRPRVTVMVRPVTLKALHKKLQDMIPEGATAS